MSFAQYLSKLRLANLRPGHKPCNRQSQGPKAGSISIENVTKSFRKRTATKKSYTTVKAGLLANLSLRLRALRFGKNRRQELSQRGNILRALDRVSFEVAPGSSVGIIGRNGSGKSTLLKLISGIYRTDSGRVAVNGTISALIELGAGFHPDFSGRENVYLGGIMYGLSKSEINKKFDSIVAYAELEEFIDDPVRTYSSGMYMRLGFSLAIHTDPDILLIDEVLAVGDAAFINRCQDTISDFRRRGKTLVFVTHDLPSVSRWCDQAIWLEKGKIRESGEPRWVIDQYLKAVETEEEQGLAERNAAIQDQTGAAWLEENLPVDKDLRSKSRKRWGGLEVEITTVSMLDSMAEKKWLFHQDDSVVVELEYRINSPIDELVFGIGIIRVDGLEVHGTNTSIEDLIVPLPPNWDCFNQEATGEKPSGIVRFEIPRLGLLENSYYIDVAAHRNDGRPYDYHHRMHMFSMRNTVKQSGIYSPLHRWSLSTNYGSTGNSTGFAVNTVEKKKAFGG